MRHNFVTLHGTISILRQLAIRTIRHAGSVIACLFVLVSLATDTAAWQQRPATPCPCSADGNCHPQGPWGFTGTKWRPWPGDIIGGPAATEEVETREQLPLDPFELPLPEKEGERGPKTSKRPKAPRGEEAPAEENANEAPEPALPLPDMGPLPGAQPEGGAGLPGGFGLEEPAGEKPAEAIGPPPEINQPQEVIPPAFDPPKGPAKEPTEEEKPAQPEEEFDPFSQLEQPHSVPTRTSRRAAPISINQDDAPPALPPSLRKVSKTGSAASKNGAYDSRYVQSAALVP